MDQAHGRKLTLLHAKEFEDALVIIFISINSDEENLSLEALCDFASSTGDLFGISVTLANKDEQVVLNLTAKNFLGTFVVKLDDEW